MPASTIRRAFAYKSRDPRSTQLKVSLDAMSFAPWQLKRKTSFSQISFSATKKGQLHQLLDSKSYTLPDCIKGECSLIKLTKLTNKWTEKVSSKKSLVLGGWMDGWMDGWVGGGWVGGCKSRFKDWLHQSKMDKLKFLGLIS